MARVDYVNETYYKRHLQGGARKLMNNPVDNEEAALVRMYRRVLSEICVNRFTWTNVPNSIDVRHLEMTLFYNTLAVWYYDTEFNKYLALKGTGYGQPNMYDNAQEFRVYGNAMINKRLSARECVPIWSNFMRAPDLDIVLIYSRKLAEVDRTIEINSRNARRTRVLAVDENQRLSGENINRLIDSGAGHIPVNMDISGMVSALDMQIDTKSITDLHTHRTRLWNECMGLLGINNANQDKKERLVESEVGANDDQVMMTRNVNLRSRRIAAQQINEMSRWLDGTPWYEGSDENKPDWPHLDIGVEYSNDVPDMPAAPDESPATGDDEATDGVQNVEQVPDITVEEAQSLRERFDALGVAVRAGVDPDSAARLLGLAGVKFTGAMPVQVRLPEAQAEGLEDEAEAV